MTNKSENQSAQTAFQLGLTTLVALVVANMIGAGVFTSSGYSLGALGNPQRVMLAWWLCGLWAMAGATAYGSLVSRLPMSGGEYLFLSRFVHPSIGFLAGWISVIAGFTFPIAIAAKTAAEYLVPELGSIIVNLVASALILVAAVSYLSGLKVGVTIQNAVVAIKLVLLVVILVVAFLFTSKAEWQGAALPGRESSMLPNNWSNWVTLFGSMSWVALSYTGFNAAIYVAGEAREAAKLVPRAMLLATVLVTVLYLLLNYVFVFAPAPQSIENQKLVAGIAASSVGGAKLEFLVRIVIVMAMITSVYSLLLAGPRVYQKMAADGVMPKLFDSDGAPVVATVVQAVAGIVAVWGAQLLTLMSYLGLTLAACSSLAVISLWWSRRRFPDLAPLSWWEQVAIVVYLLISAAILVGASLEPLRRMEFYTMLGTFVVGALLYVVWSLVDTKNSTKPIAESTKH